MPYTWVLRLKIERLPQISLVGVMSSSLFLGLGVPGVPSTERLCPYLMSNFEYLNASFGYMFLV
jgi:hypothetical protein